MTESAEPYGATRVGAGEAWQFTLSSRGDRVRGRVRAPSGPGPHAIVLIATDATAAPSEWHEALPECAVVAIDLPLCGARASDKLRLGDVGPGDVLWPDLIAQVAHDVVRTLAWLHSQPDLDATRSVYVALGGACQLASGLGDHTKVCSFPNAASPDWSAIKRALG